MTVREQVEQENWKKLNRRLWIAYFIIALIGVATMNYKWAYAIPVVAVIGIAIHFAQNPGRPQGNGPVYSEKVKKNMNDDHFIYTQMFLNDKK